MLNPPKTREEAINTIWQMVEEWDRFDSTTFIDAVIAMGKAKLGEKDYASLYQDARNLWNVAPEESHNGWLAQMQEALDKGLSRPDPASQAPRG